MGMLATPTSRALKTWVNKDIEVMTSLVDKDTYSGYQYWRLYIQEPLH